MPLNFCFKFISLSPPPLPLRQFDWIAFAVTCSKNVLYRISFSRSECSLLVRFKLPFTDRAMCSIFQLELCMRYIFSANALWRSSIKTIMINEEFPIKYNRILVLTMILIFSVMNWNQLNCFDDDTFYPWNIFFFISFCQRFVTFQRK